MVPSPSSRSLPSEQVMKEEVVEARFVRKRGAQRFVATALFQELDDGLRSHLRDSVFDGEPIVASFQSPSSWTLLTMERLFVREGDFHEVGVLCDVTGVDFEGVSEQGPTSLVVLFLGWGPTSSASMRGRRSLEGLRGYASRSCSSVGSELL